MTILRRFDDARIPRSHACVDSDPERNTLFRNLNDAPARRVHGRNKRHGFTIGTATTSAGTDHA
jgi:hypothetical protein